MKKNKGIRKKLTRLIMAVTIFAILSMSCLSVFSMLNMRSRALETAMNDAYSSLSDLANSRSQIADSMLLVAQNQTLMVADGAKKVLENSDTYLTGYSEGNLPDLSCAKKDLLGKYSMHIRVPENLLQNVKKDESGKVTNATLNHAADLGGAYTVNEELYLSSMLSNELSQIERFRNDDGSYTGFSATYFCFADSGIDVLGDLETQPMICYDARESGWYKSTSEAWKNKTLSKNGVYWTDPVQDGSGRGISLICAAPVTVDGKIVGIAGSGGLLINFAELIKSTSLGDTGYSFIINRDTSKVIINPNTTAENAEKSEVQIETVLNTSQNGELSGLSEKIKNNPTGITTCTIDGKKMIVAYSALDNVEWSMVTVISEKDNLIVGSINHLDGQIFMTLLVYAALFAVAVCVILLVTRRYSKRFTEPIILLKEGAKVISGGDLDHRLSISTGDEIEELGEAFNHMAINLDTYIKNLASITAEKERIGAELNVATQIQASMLPCIFPAFPERKEFDIYASMNPAKEVGGDFYDFFLVDDDHLAVVMADVSGKGVPAALFMVIAKTLIKDRAQAGLSPDEVFTMVNQQLCESNEEGLFVTAWLGVMEISTGHMVYVNAGHNPPLVCKADEQYEYLRMRPGFVLAGMEGMKYKTGEIELKPGDFLYLYTDGVTEATNADNQLYGEERLRETLNENKEKIPEDVLIAVKADIDAFVGSAPQFDDITMLGLKIRRPGETE